MILPLIRVANLGRQEYLRTLGLQHRLAANLKAARDEGGGGQHHPADHVLILVEHTPVYTTGMRTKDYSVEEEKALVKLGAQFIRTNRGGLITFHGPGQLVAYPILDLLAFIPQANRRKAALGMKWYIHTLEEIVIQVCREFNVTAGRSPHTGVWVGDNKICAMGVHSSQLVTTHGLALNCSTDMKWFEHIVPCGIVDKGVTSLSREVGRLIGPAEVIPRLLAAFGTVLAARLEPYTPAEVADLLDKFSTPVVKPTS